MSGPNSIGRPATMARDAAARPRGPVMDIGQILDDGPWTPLQGVVIVFAGLAILMDGFNSQLVGFALPALMKDWHVGRDAVAPSLAAALVGMACGAASAGLFADRFGRRIVLVASVATYGLASCLVGFSSNLVIFSILRFVAGVGIGGALPSGTTMTAEFTPARARTMAVTATIVCVPLGGMLAGLFAGPVLPTLGWRGLFAIGGLTPMVLVPLLLLYLPETPRFLAHHPRRWPELTRLLGRMSRQVPADAAFRDSREENLDEGAGVRALFTPGLARDTIAIGCVFLMSLLAIYSVFSWLPTMLTAEGMSARAAGGGLTAYNLGGVFGALLCATVIKRYGSRWPLVVYAGGGAASAFLLRGVNVLEHPQLLILGLVVHGFCANAVQSVMYAVCAYVYPTNVRATGAALGLTIGRVGAILSSFTGAAMINIGGATAYFGLLGVAMACVLIALVAVRRHIPAVARQVCVAEIPVTEA